MESQEFRLLELAADELASVSRRIQEATDRLALDVRRLTKKSEYDEAFANYINANQELLTAMQSLGEMLARFQAQAQMAIGETLGELPVSTSPSTSNEAAPLVVSFYREDEADLAFTSVAMSTRRKSGDLDFAIYLGDNDAVALRLMDVAMQDLVQSLGYPEVVWGPPRAGSIRHEGHTRGRSLLSRRQIKSRLDKVEKSIEATYRELPQSQANFANAQAVVSLTNAHANVADVVVQLGSLLFVKWTDEHGVARVLSRVLSVHEQMLLEDDPTIRFDARAAWDFLTTSKSRLAELKHPQASKE